VQYYKFACTYPLDLNLAFLFSFCGIRFCIFPWSITTVFARANNNLIMMKWFINLWSLEGCALPSTRMRDDLPPAKKSESRAYLSRHNCSNNSPTTFNSRRQRLCSWVLLWISLLLLHLLLLLPPRCGRIKHEFVFLFLCVF